jgi:putative phage-type endonuclease
MTYDMKNDQQGDEAWLADRLGKVTASAVYRICQKTKAGKPTAEYQKYMNELLGERLTREPKDFFKTKSMVFGTESEPQARAAYEFRTDNQVEDAGFVDHPHIAMAGASPDGLVGSDGLIEVKCPDTSTMVAYMAQFMADGGIEEKYLMQMQWQMACTGRAFCDYVVFDPRVKDPSLQMFVTRIPRDPAMIADMEAEVIAFQDKLALLEADFRTATSQFAA